MTVLSAVVLVAVPSLTTNLTVREVVGVWLVVANWTDRRTVCQSAMVAVPVRARMSGAALVSVIPVPPAVKVSASPVWRPALMVTVADSRLVSSGSVTVRPPSTVTAAPSSVKVGVEPDSVIVGASLTAATVIVRVSLSERAPSFDREGGSAVSRGRAVAGVGVGDRPQRRLEGSDRGGSGEVEGAGGGHVGRHGDPGGRRREGEDVLAGLAAGGQLHARGGEVAAVGVGHEHGRVDRDRGAAFGEGSCAGARDRPTGASGTALTVRVTVTVLLSAVPSFAS